ncbi:hypothetical protein BH24ACT15_BH24ACT15_33540 [soil metagenome]
MTDIVNCDPDPFDACLARMGGWRQLGRSRVETKDRSARSSASVCWDFPRRNDEVPVLASFPLRSGNLLELYDVANAGLKGVLMLESGKSHTGVLSNVPGLRGLAVSPLDVYWALSLPGTPLPEILTEMFISPAGDAPQGWGGTALLAAYPNPTEVPPAGSTADDDPAESLTGRVEPQAGGDLACSNPSFNSSIAFGFLSDDPFIRNDKTPNNYSAFYDDCLNPGFGECVGEPRYRYTANAGLVNQWRGKVCGRAVQNASNDHIVDFVDENGVEFSVYYGPSIAFEYYWSGWRLMESNSGKVALVTIPANALYHINWAWYTSEPTGHRISIRYAKGNDEFDIMMDRSGGF